jgi:hypothetical protein
MRIVSIVTTNHSLDFDDRVNKECESLMKNGHNVAIIALETKNEPRKGLTKYGASFQTIRLITREYFSSGKGLPAKMIEWNLRILVLLTVKKWDAIWLNDFDGIIAILYARVIKIFFSKRRIVWDHHELAPERFLRSPFYRWLISFSDIVIQANQERVLYTQSHLPEKYHSKFVVIENYPSAEFMSSKTENADQHFKTWIKGQEYCLFQGAALTYRKVMESIECIYSISNMKLVIMGPCDDSTRNAIKTKWPDYESRVFITGWTAQKDFYGYMDGAVASLVFYENIDTNHWLCAPNRFFNAILRGIPVICGPNPPMKTIVEIDEIGLSCASNGDDHTEIAAAVIQIRDNQDEYRSRCESTKSKFVWQNQDQLFNHLLV